jgi:hypothetical protein
LVSKTFSQPVAFFESEMPYVKGRQLGFAMTSKEPDTCVTCVVTCEDQWSMVQMEAIDIMKDEQDESGGFLTHAMRRAKRTAGNYAQLFLDDEGTDKAGRFYWTGLAAFAAKQVVEGMATAGEFIRGRPQSLVGAVRFSAAVTYYYLAKGNLWVFLEVVPWHLFYRQHGPALFAHCSGRRNVETYDKPVKAKVKELPWASGPYEGMLKLLRKEVSVANFDHPVSSPPLKDGAALAEMNNCRMTEPLRNAFAYIQAYEMQTDKDDKNSAAYNAASAALQHEQELHLQRMIYDHPEFQSAMSKNDWARGFPRLAWLFGATDPALFFHADAQVDDATYQRDVAPYGITREEIAARMEVKDGHLYIADDRMKYVKQILKKYHRLMTSVSGGNGKPPHREYIVGQLRVIAELWRHA